MKRVMLTGANGFVGQYVLDMLLRENIEVHAISRSERGCSENNKVIWHQANLFDAVQVKELFQRTKPSHLLHLAWETTPGIYWRSLANFQWVEASLGLVRFFYEYGGERLVVAGTCAEYDWSSGILIEEQTSLSYSSSYAACKNGLRSLLEQYAQQTGLSFAWGRVFFIYGPHEPPMKMIPTVVRSLLLNEPANCTEGKQMRDFIYVADAAAAFCTLLLSNWNGVVNIASGEAVAVKEVVMSIASKMGRSELVRLGAVQTNVEEPPVVQGNIDRIKALNWRPQFGLETGLDQTIAWWKEKLEGG